MPFVYDLGVLVFETHALEVFLSGFVRNLVTVVEAVMVPIIRVGFLGLLSGIQFGFYLGGILGRDVFGVERILLAASVFHRIDVVALRRILRIVRGRARFRRFRLHGGHLYPGRGRGLLRGLLGRSRSFLSSRRSGERIAGILDFGTLQAYLTALGGFFRFASEYLDVFQKASYLCYCLGFCHVL